MMTMLGWWLSVSDCCSLVDSVYLIITLTTHCNGLTILTGANLCQMVMTVLDENSGLGRIEAQL